MRFNKIVPELAVTNITESIAFYVKVLGFKIEFERQEDKFAFLSYQGSQVMLVEDSGDWITAVPEYPRGRGINFEIETNELADIVKRLRRKKVNLFRDPKQNEYQVGKLRVEVVTELLVQDPDGYLLRFQQTAKNLLSKQKIINRKS